MYSNQVLILIFNLKNDFFNLVLGHIWLNMLTLQSSHNLRGKLYKSCDESQ